MRVSGADSREPNQQSQRNQRGQPALDSCELCNPCLSGNYAGAANADCCGPASYANAIAHREYCGRPVGRCKYADSYSTSTYRDANCTAPGAYQHAGPNTSYTH